VATVQLRNPGVGRDYYDRKRASGKTSMEAMRCLKRRLSDIVYRAMLDDAFAHATKAQGAGPGEHRETSLQSSAAGSHPHTGTLDQSLPGPARSQRRTPLPAAS
jgi:transposase